MDTAMKCPKCGAEAADKDAMMAHWNEAHAGEPMPAEANEVADAVEGEEKTEEDAAPAADENPAM